MVATRPGDDPTPRAGEGGPRRTTAQLATDPAFTNTYVRGQVRNASGVLDPTKQAIIVLDANGDIDDIQIAAVS